jgi:hypothetical protein
MSATSSAGSLGSFFALGKQAAKGTAATALFKALATTSYLANEFEERDSVFEHPAAVAGRNTAVKSPLLRTGYLVTAEVATMLHPKFIGMSLLASGFAVVTTGTSPDFTHVFTLTTGALHKWMTCAWNVDETDGAFVTRGVDCRATAFGLNATPTEIEHTLTMSGLTLEPMSGSPTYTSEVSDEIVPWLGARTTLTVGGYAVVERVRGVNFQIENSLRSDDPALWEIARVDLPQTSIGATCEISDINISDDIYEALVYGAANASSVSLAAITGAIDIKWTSASNIPTGAVPYSLQIAMPSVSWSMSSAPQASADDMITVGLTATMVDNVATPLTITLVNDVASY